MALKDYNPFAKRSEYSSNNLMVYKILTFVSWALVVVFGIIYTFGAPDDCHKNKHCRTIWGQNNAFPSPFALNSVVTSIYWIVVLLLQGHYLRYLWNADTQIVNSAAGVGSHFIFNNLFIFAFIMLWVREKFWIAEVMLILNWFNLTSLYFRHSKSPVLIHVPIVSAPYAWNYIALLWCGAAAVNAKNLPARILANIFIWGILGTGGFFLLAFKDWSMGFELAILSLSIALGQFATKIFALQWIFAFVIMGCLILMTLFIGIPGMFGQDRSVRREGGIVSEDRERAPLLEDR